MALDARRTRTIATAIVVILVTVLGVSRASAGAGDVRLAKGPYVTGVFATGADVRFELDRASPASLTVVRDADPKARPQTFESRDVADMHVVRVTGLEAATRYGYAVRVGSALVGDGYFSTAPGELSDAPVTFLVYGDDRTDPVAHGAIARAMMQVPSAFLVNTGDMVEDGGDSDAWQTFFGVEAPLFRERPVFVAVGNHELLEDSAGVNFARYFGFPDAAGKLRLYGTLRYGPLRLFFLNAMHGWDSGEERDWLTHALTAADSEPGVVWRIAVAHHGPWSSGPHGPNDKLLDARIPELLTAHKVELFLSGHDHIYERGSSGGLKYLVSGGGGAPLYRVERAEVTTLKAESTYHFVEIEATSSTLRVVAHRVDGTVLDRCGFGRGQPWDCDPPRGTVAAEARDVGKRPRSSSCSHNGCSEYGTRRFHGPAPAVFGVLTGLAGLRRRGGRHGLRPKARGGDVRGRVRTRRVFRTVRAALP
jgi:hypothetical protein